VETITTAAPPAMAIKALGSSPITISLIVDETKALSANDITHALIADTSCPVSPRTTLDISLRINIASLLRGSVGSEEFVEFIISQQ
jgi:hypothetical protein